MRDKWEDQTRTPSVENLLDVIQRAIRLDLFEWVPTVSALFDEHHSVVGFC